MARGRRNSNNTCGAITVGTLLLIGAIGIIVTGALVADIFAFMKKKLDRSNMRVTGGDEVMAASILAVLTGFAQIAAAILILLWMKRGISTCWIKIVLGILFGIYLICLILPLASGAEVKGTDGKARWISFFVFLGINMAICIGSFISSFFC